MAYPTICAPCREEKCEDCLKAGWDVPENPPEEFCGGGFCVCGHGSDENAFQREVRKNIAEKT